MWALMSCGAVALAQTGSDGEIAGLITDESGGILPGVTVTVTGGDISRTAVTDITGRFVLDSLPLTTHTVTAELPGFRSRSGELVLSTAQPRGWLAWSLGLGCLVMEVTVLQPLRHVAGRVDEVAHVRVVSADGAISWPLRPDCPGERLRQYTVDVLARVPRSDRPARGPDQLQVFLIERKFRELVPGQE